MWWCFVKAMWKAVRGRLGLTKIVFKVTEKKGTGKKAEGEDKGGLLAQSKGSGLSDAEVAVMYGLVDANGEYDEEAVQALQEQLAEAAGQQEHTHATCSMHHAPCTMHHAPCTMHHAPCAMHCAPCPRSRTRTRILPHHAHVPGGRRRSSATAPSTT